MQVIVDKHTVTIVKNEIVNEGEYNVQSCNFQFSSDYDGLPKIAVFKTGTVTKQIMLSGNTCITPEEVLQTTGIVGLGVYAYQTDGDNLTLRYSPTPAVFTVEPGSYDEGDAPTPPTPSVIEQLQEEITQNANDITSLENVTDTHTTQIGTLQTDVNNIKTEQITQNTNIQTNANDISNIKTEQITQNNNIQANADDITTLQTSLSNETTNRENADINLQQQIDAITSSSDIVDIVGTYAQLMAYDTQHLSNNDVIKVLQDETHENAMTYYRWDKHNSQWIYIGQESPYYTKSETDTLLQGKANASDVYTKSQIDDTLEDYALKTDLTDFVTEQDVDTKLEDYVETTTYTQGQAAQDTNIQNNTDSIENIESLIEQMPTVSGQGTDISLQNVYNYRLMKFLPQGVSSQDGEPTPTTPVPVNNVTGENSLKISNENLLDYTKWASGSILDDGSESTNVFNAKSTNYILVAPNTTYSFLTNNNITSLRLNEYTNNKVHVQRIVASSTNKLTITTTANTHYLRWSLNYNNATAITQELLKDLDLMLVKGSTAPTTYVPHEEQNYQLSFGNMEFNSSPDGTIRDRIIGSSDVSYNLFDGARKNVYFNNQKQFASGTADALTTNYIPASEGDIFTISTELASSGIVIASFDKNKVCISRSAVGTSSLSLTYTCPANTKYIIGSNFIGMTTNTTLVKGSEAKPYFPYGQVGMWYKREYIGKVVLDGSESWSISTTQDGNYRYHKENFIDAKNDIGYCTHFKIGNIADRNVPGQINKFFVGSITQAPQTLQFVSDITTVANFKAFLQTQYNNNNPVTVYYEHIESVDIPITDTTLISQLNDIYNNAHSYNGTTNITTTYEDGNEQMYLDIEALAKGGSSSAETDPVFSASASSGITSSDISNWNGKASTTYVDTAISNAITNTLGGSY